MSKGPTKRQFDATLRALREPSPLTLEQALEKPNAVAEIAGRLSHKPASSMSGPEKVFWSVSYFVGDTLNGGLEQSLTNDTGELVPLFAEFAKRYGSPELVAVIEQIVALFPSGQIPADRNERLRVISEADPERLDHLTEAFYACETAIDRGLIALARNNLAQFNLMGGT